MNMKGKMYFKDGRTVEIEAGKCYGNYDYVDDGFIQYNVTEIFSEWSRSGGYKRFSECKWLAGIPASPPDFNYIHFEFEAESAPIQLKELVLPENISSLKIWHGYEIEKPLVVPIGVKYVYVPNYIEIANLEELDDCGAIIHFVVNDEVRLDSGREVLEYYTNDNENEWGKWIQQ